MNRQRRIFPVCFLILVGSWACGGQLAAQITLFQDFDSGSLDVANSSVAGNQVSLVGRNTWTQSGFENRYRWVYFRADQVNGTTPQFSIDAGSFLGSLNDHRYVYSYDQQNWEFFDNGDNTGR